MDQRIIVDVGLHRGVDTDFYLRKGFRVEAVEADPELAHFCEKKFSQAVEAKRLRIHNVAIARESGQVTFFRIDGKDDWGTISPQMLSRNEIRGRLGSPITVPAVRFDEIIDRIGETPYYIKIDIEGADIHCIEALHRINRRSPYLSLEMNMEERDSARAELSHLYALGYRSFKFINQVTLPDFRFPNPPLEGEFVDRPFIPHSSGPFGEETPGPWLSFRMALDRLDSIFLKAQRHAKVQRMGRPLANPFEKWHTLRGDPLGGWYDIHAKLTPEGD